MPKAKSEITLYHITDISEVIRYYILQPSTSGTPNVPTINPPSGWTTTEPTYDSGSTNTLYFVDLTEFTDGTWQYSAVSKSSSYEAAKEAYNKAQNAQDTAGDANSKAEDAQEKVSEASASIEIIEGVLKMIATDEEGTSLLDQTSDGWSFNIYKVGNELAEAQKALENLNASMGNIDEGTDVKTMIGELENLINDLNSRTAYIDMKTETVNGNTTPYLELGQRDDQDGFKVKITKSTITFRMGSLEPIRLENIDGEGYVLADKLTVSNELRIGEYVWQVRANGNVGLVWKGALG